MARNARTAYTKSRSAGAWAVTAGAAIWGLFWIPLRYLENAGIPGLWAIALVLLAALIPSILLTVKTGELAELTTVNGWLIGAALSLSTVLYFAAVLYTDVIRAIFLFYLLPMWTTLSARVLYGEPIRSSQLAIILAALFGVWLLLGGGMSIPLPNNVGDWCAIGAGFCWGVSLSLLRGREETPPFSSTSAVLFAGAVLASLCALTLGIELPDIAHVKTGALSLTALAGLILGFGALMFFPSLLGQIWGARKIPAPTAALLTMTEILVATASAGWLIGTELTAISLLGGLVIIGAVCIDLILKRGAMS